MAGAKSSALGSFPMSSFAFLELPSPLTSKTLNSKQKIYSI